MFSPLSRRPWRFRPELWTLELRDMPGSLLGTLLPDALITTPPPNNRATV
ncbi:MAG TPA: hypothetical protein VFG68_19410 [Fimbriiglobus sp.]|nr:hypothetical protein [Fimbriiglobus sp.]